MRRRPVVAIAVACGAAVVLGLGVWTLVDSPSSEDEVCGLFGEEADAVVFWATDAPDAAADQEQLSIQEEVDDLRGVDSVEGLESEETWERLVESAEAAGVDVTSASLPATFPASLAVTYTDGGWADVEVVHEELTDAPWSRVVLARDEPGGPFREVVPERWDRTDLAVFFEPGSSAESLDALASELAATDGVEGVETFTREQAYDEFAALFADSPELVATVSPEILPPSVRVTMDDPGDVDLTESLAESAEQRSDVREAVLPVSASLFSAPFLADFATAC